MTDMKMPYVAIITSIVAVCVSAASAGLDIPLDLRPDKGSGGMRIVSNGVPLLAGQASDPAKLRVVGPDGREVAAQFRVLARWWRQDDSIRWVLVTFIRSDKEPADPTYRLVAREAAAAKPVTPLGVAIGKESIGIDTGAAWFEISRKSFNLFNKVVVGGKTLVEPDAKLGSVVTDPQGRKYYSALGTQSVKVLEFGPVMAKVLAQGVHVSKEDGAFEPGLYGYEIVMTFHAGRATVDIDAILTNNSLKAIGEPHFEDWSLVTRIGDGGTWNLRTLGEKSVKVNGDAAESTVLYQDSVGNEHWKVNLGLKPSGYTGTNKGPLPQLAGFRGYKVWKLAGGKKTEAHHGDFADGMIDCNLGGAGCTVSPRHFWQQFPSAVGFGGDGLIRMSPFPAEYKEVHWLEDTSAKAQEFQLCFYVNDAKGGRKTAEMAARRYQKRIFALPSPKHCGDAGALSDIGPYMMHEKIAKPAKEHFSLAKLEQRALRPGGDYNNCYGWQVFGMNWIERAGVSGTNYEPLASSNHLWMHLLNAHPGRLESGMRIARHYRDVRTYHIEGQDNLAVWTTWQPGYWKNCTIEHWSRLIPGTFGHQKARHPDWKKHPYTRHRWPLPNLEHLNLDEVYDLYCLTGDDRAFRCMRTIADHGVALATLSGRPRRVYRKEGWCLRAIARYYDLTGDQRYKPHLKKAIDQIWEDVEKAGPTSGGTWYACIYARAAAAAWLATGDERMRDLAIGCAEWSAEYGVATKGFAYHSPKEPWLLSKDKRGGKYGCRAWAAGYHMVLYGFAYAQTGEERYLPLFEFAYEKNAGTWWLGYFPAAMYMAYGPRQDKTAPAAVTDLAATVEDSRAILTWTAPGDDAKTGTATVYQIKHASKPILNFVPFPQKRRTHITFWGSENVADEPAPAPAGTKQRYVLKAKPGTYYVAMKTRDECSNQSGLSNVVKVVVGR